ncbi:bifunctional homocysteine S-methyltransferase/methylenetetrahydrofolate reductase [candidate division KSB1 bacterium]
MKDFRNHLNNEPVIVLDGGMGTSLYDRGIFINQSFDDLNISNPKMVKEIHKEFANAGAEVLETNSFGANYVKLRPHGLDDKVFEINKKAAEIAKEVAGDSLFVAGVIGPLGKKVQPFGKISQEDAYKYFKEQASGLSAGNVDLFILETFTYLEELKQAVTAVQDISKLPVLALVTVKEDGSTLIGMEPEGYIPIIESWGVDGVGVNCSIGPQAMLNAIERIVKITKLPIVAEPNAGIPRIVDGRNLYLCSPEYISTYVQRYIELGVKIVGGCCGTKGEHIKAIKNAAKQVHPTVHTEKINVSKIQLPEINVVPAEEKSDFSNKILNGKFVTSIEIVPPRGWDISEIIQKTEILKKSGIDCINVPDGPRASARMSPQVMSYLVQKKVGIEVILHYCCRDRNLLGMQSDILGNFSAGIKNLLIITGDPPKVGDYPDATAVFDVDSIGLTRIVNNLNHGYDIGGNAIGRPTSYFIGVGSNPNAVDLNREINRFFQKVEAGAEYAITQPVFDPESFFSYLEKIKDTNIPIIAGIWPLISYRNADFMKHEVPGVYVPDHILERMKVPSSKEESLEEGIKIAREILSTIKDHVSGVQVSSPFGHIEYSLQVLKDIIL